MIINQNMWPVCRLFLTQVLNAVGGKITQMLWDELVVRLCNIMVRPKKTKKKSVWRETEWKLKLM